MGNAGEDTFATALAGALSRRRVTLTWLRDRLAARGHPVSLATLSYWRGGQRVPSRLASLDAVAEVEALLGLRPGALMAHVHERRHASRVTPFDEIVLGLDNGSAVGERDVERIFFHLCVDVDREAGTIVSDVTQMYVAARHLVEGVSMFVGPDSDGSGNSTHVESVSGCRIGEITDTDEGIRRVWLEFERPLHLGESTLVQTRVIDSGPQALEETEYGLVAEERLEEALVMVRFRSADLPSRAWIAYDEGQIRDEWEVELRGQSVLHQRMTNFGPGTCRIRWEW